MKKKKFGVFLQQIEYTVGASEQLFTCNSVLVSILQAWVAMPDLDNSGMARLQNILSFSTFSLL